MADWVREEEKASENRQKKKEAEEADKVEVAPEVTVTSLRRFRTAFKLDRPKDSPSGVGCADRKPETLRVRCCRCYAFGCKCEKVVIRGVIGWLAAGSIPNSLYRVPLFELRASFVFVPGHE